MIFFLFIFTKWDQVSTLQVAQAHFYHPSRWRNVSAQWRLMSAQTIVYVFIFKNGCAFWYNSFPLASMCLRACVLMCYLAVTWTKCLYCNLSCNTALQQLPTVATSTEIRRNSSLNVFFACRMFLLLSWENNKWMFMVMMSHFVSRIFPQYIIEKQALCEWTSWSYICCSPCNSLWPVENSDYFYFVVCLPIFLPCNWNIVNVYLLLSGQTKKLLIDTPWSFPWLQRGEYKGGCYQRAAYKLYKKGH